MILRLLLVHLIVFCIGPISNANQGLEQCDDIPINEFNRSIKVGVSGNYCKFPKVKGNVQRAKIETNCVKILNSGDVPKDAFLWTMEVYKKNLGKLEMSQCIQKFEEPNHYSLRKFSEKKLLHGIQNPCQILINDTRERYIYTIYKTRVLHYIDLCEGKVVSDRFHLGDGTLANGFSNKPGKNSTVLGAFLTTDKIFSFRWCKIYSEETGACKAAKTGYTELADEYFKGEKIILPSVALIGLQNSNNQSANHYKYLHVSPGFLNLGCVTIEGKFEQKHRMITTLAKNGPSLVVNYGDKMEDPKECI